MLTASIFLEDNMDTSQKILELSSHMNQKFHFLGSTPKVHKLFRRGNALFYLLQHIHNTPKFGNKCSKTDKL